MKIYIAGKITGLPADTAFRNFDRAEKKLKDEGHMVINPMRMYEYDLEHHRYMAIARNILCDEGTEAVYMLDNWRDSPGAMEEHDMAEQIGLPIYYEDSAKEVRE